MKRLKGTQIAILRVFVDHVDQHHGIPPTIAEIGEAVGIKSKSAVSYHLQRMVDDGLLYALGWHTKRGITITEAGRKAINRGLKP